MKKDIDTGQKSTINSLVNNSDRNLTLTSYSTHNLDMPVPGGVQGGQNPTQGLVHWMSAVMAEHMTSNTHHDPGVGMHYMWNGAVEVKISWKKMLLSFVLGITIFLLKFFKINCFALTFQPKNLISHHNITHCRRRYLGETLHTQH